MNAKLKSPGDRAIGRLPRVELEHRWAKIRTHLQEEHLQALIVFAMDDYLSANVRWLTDRAANFAQRMAVVFHSDGLMTLVEHGDLHGRRKSSGTELDYPGIGEILSAPSFSSVAYTLSMEGEIVSGLLRSKRYTRVGIAGKEAMPFGFVAELQKTAGVEFVDMTEFLDEVRSIKSATELDEIRATASMQDRVFAGLLAAVRPGMRDIDISATILSLSRREGSSQNVVFVGSAGVDSSPYPQMPSSQGRTIGRGDYVTVLIETNGAGGYYTELGRAFVLGKKGGRRAEAHSLACAAQEETIRRLCPGASCAEIAEAHNAFRASNGLAPERRLFAHGQGYALVERPLIREDETMNLGAGMNIVAHPAFVMGTSFGWICDNYIVHAKGPAERLHKTEQIIFEVEA